jgi:hypothetical protein
MVPVAQPAVDQDIDAGVRVDHSRHVDVGVEGDLKGIGDACVGLLTGVGGPTAGVSYGGGAAAIVGGRLQDEADAVPAALLLDGAEIKGELQVPVGAHADGAGIPGHAVDAGGVVGEHDTAVGIGRYEAEAFHDPGDAGVGNGPALQGQEDQPEQKSDFHHTKLDIAYHDTEIVCPQNLCNFNFLSKFISFFALKSLKSKNSRDPKIWEYAYFKSVYEQFDFNLRFHALNDRKTSG